MRISLTCLAVVASLVVIGAGGAALANGKAADEVAGLVKSLMRHGGADWSSVEDVKAIAWKPLPPKVLQDCLPDGGCFTRSGSAKIGGHAVSILATGARTMVFNFYVKNSGAHVGEEALVEALKGAGLGPVLARCPFKPKDAEHNSKWWRVKNGNAKGFVSLTYSCGKKSCEGVGYSAGPDLPKLDPGELAMYSEQCIASVAPTKAVSSELPHQAVARMIADMLPAANESQPYSWDILRSRLTGVSWNKALWPHDPAVSYDDDPNHWMLSGSGMLSLATREFSLAATGDKANARLVRMDEAGSHPKGEDTKLLQALKDDGFQVALARCGKDYTEQKLTWYKLIGDKTRGAYLLIDTGNEGKREHTRYRIYLDGQLPPIKQGEANVGTGQCR